MSYVALYRKWRPKTFDEVKGQEAVCTTLKNQIISGRTGHAYLFCGTRGTGKTSVAKILARAVNCEHPVNGNPCGTCAMCRAIQEERSMNVQEIDAASNNGVDNIRDIRDQVQYPPTEGKYRVFIIDEVHMLSAGAFNALLKTLEEPPAYVIFILATTEVNKIPVTVLSRCQRYDFHRIPAETITEHLRELTKAEGLKIEDRALSYIARQADGAMRDALSLLDECAAFHPDSEISYDEVLEILGAVDVDTFAALFRAVSGGKTGDALQILDRSFEEGREMSQFVSDFLWYLRNLLVLRTSADADRLVDCAGEKLAEMKKDAAAANGAQLIRYIRTLSELSNRLRYSAEKRVLTELALIRLSSPEMDDTADALAERIEDLEREVRSLRAEGIRAVPAAEAAAAAGRETGAAGSGSAVGSGSAAGAGAAPAPTPKKVVLPRAEYADYQKIRGDWGRITSGVGGIYGAALEGTTVEPAGNGVMTVVFPNMQLFRFGGDKAIKALEDYVRNNYQKEITFRTRVKAGGESPDSVIVTEEEIEAAVHFPIEHGGET